MNKSNKFSFFLAIVSVFNFVVITPNAQAFDKSNEELLQSFTQVTQVVSHKPQTAKEYSDRLERLLSAQDMKVLEARLQSSSSSKIPEILYQRNKIIINHPDASILIEIVQSENTFVKINGKSYSKDDFASFETLIKKMNEQFKIESSTATKISWLNTLFPRAEATLGDWLSLGGMLGLSGAIVWAAFKLSNITVKIPQVYTLNGNVTGIPNNFNLNLPTDYKLTTGVNVTTPAVPTR